ncbi:hypothetical protein DL93DRAFT_1697724 [Clavulina sp. PMI_390]|nr:hypothetical protein DL93DRAFT_1697724 [Clavulina sp. PMI_390]
MPHELEQLSMSILPDLESISKSIQAIISSIAQAWPPTHHEPPVLAHRTPLARVEQSQKIEIAVRDVEKVLEPISVMVDMLSGLESQLKVRKSRLQMALNPLSALPDDVVALIFDQFREEGRSNQNHASWQFSIKLSHVSACWRAVAIDSSYLWSRLTLTSPSQAPLIPLFAQRSRDRRLILTLLKNNPSFYHEVIPWRPGDIKLSASFAGQISEIYVYESFFDHNSIPVLVIEEEAIAQLDLEYLCFKGALLTVPWGNPLLAATKRLHLSQNYFSFTFSHRASFVHLEELTLGSIWENNSPLDCLHNLPMPALRRLVLIYSGNEDGSPRQYEGKSITLPTIETLELRRCYSELYSSIGAEILLPNLRSLMVDIYDESNHSVPRFMTLVSFVHLSLLATF